MSFQLIPAIDILDGQLVRLYKGQYDQATQYLQTPVDMAMYYQSLGLNRIHVVDLNGAKDGALVNQSVIQRIANIPGITLQVGGGVRHMDHIDALLSYGVSAVIIGSLFVSNLELAIACIHQYPHQIIAGLDIQNDYLATHGWIETSQVSLLDMLSTLSAHPIQSIITTDIQKDGTMQGPNVSLYQQMATATSHPIIASGGVSAIDDVRQLQQLNLPNLHGCIVGRAIIEGHISPEDIMALS